MRKRIPLCLRQNESNQHQPEVSFSGVARVGAFFFGFCKAKLSAVVYCLYHSQNKANQTPLVFLQALYNTSRQLDKI